MSSTSDSTKLGTLLREWTDSEFCGDLDRVLSSIPRLLNLPSYNFRHGLCPALQSLDSRIAGIGLHNLEWHGGIPRMPLAPSFESISRPLEHVAYSLSVSDSPRRLMSYQVAAGAGSHLEQCVKRVPEAPQRTPLGGLVQPSQGRVISILGERLSRSIREYARFANMPKHVLADGHNEESPISFIVAVRSYFVSRALGARVLEKLGILDDLAAQTQDAARFGRFDTDSDTADPVTYLRDTGPAEAVTVRPIDVRALPDFGDWLENLRSPTRIAVFAAIQRLADAYGDELAGPHVVPWGRRAFLLRPETPAHTLSVVFSQLWGDQAVLLFGVNDWDMEKRPLKHMRMAMRRRRQAARSRGRTVTLSDLIGHLNKETQIEFDAATAYAAAVSIGYQERQISQARRLIQVDLDFIDKMPTNVTDSTPDDDNPAYYHRRALASLRLGPDMLANLPYEERVPLVPVHQRVPPKAWETWLQRD